MVKSGPFAYAGDSSSDVPIFEESFGTIFVGSYPALVERLRKKGTLLKEFKREKPRYLAILEACRPHQWLKNVLVFVPLLMAHHIRDFDLLAKCIFAFFSFSLCASSVYILNDLLDLEADRQHPRKSKRALASGGLSIGTGLIVSGINLSFSFVLGGLISSGFVSILICYFALTTAYSFGLKQLNLIDVVVLAGLYTIRLFAGGEAACSPVSQWLLVFSMFLFFSLALVKRFSEVKATLERQSVGGTERLKGRDYQTDDLHLLSQFGTASGYLAVLVFAFYINSPETSSLYSNPLRLWGICPIILYWISRVWLRAHRGQMDDDPVIFALRDRASYIAGLFILALILLAL